MSSILLQSEAWAAFQRALGRTVVVSDGHYFVRMPLPLGFSYYYAPHGPLFSDNTATEEVVQTLQSVVAAARRDHAIFIRIDPAVSVEPHWISQLQFKKVAGAVQPVHTTILDLTKSLDEIQANLRPKTRYNIRLASKKNVTVRISTDAKDLDAFLELNRQTQKRDRFTAHADNYYRKMFEALVPKGNLKLFVAELHEEGKPAKVLAVNIVTAYKQQAIYLHGTSSNEERNRMAPFALQWEAIRWAKEQGCTTYDFWGIAPTDDPTHSWAGITRFKKGFSGNVVQYIGVYDLVLRPTWYRIYQFVKRFL